MEPLEPPDTHYLNSAYGWLGLGLTADARAELDQVSPEHQMHPDVLEARWSVHAMANEWDAALAVARHLVLGAPERATGWLNHAYAMRRAIR